MALILIYDRRNVLTGQAQCYFKKLAAADYVTPPSYPADTVSLGTPWTGGWSPIGATLDGLQFGFQRRMSGSGHRNLVHRLSTFLRIGRNESGRHNTTKRRIPCFRNSTAHHAR